LEHNEPDHTGFFLDRTDAKRIACNFSIVVVIDASGAARYNSSGEVDEAVISGVLDKALR
jgi:hypothetical protein